MRRRYIVHVYSLMEKKFLIVTYHNKIKLFSLSQIYDVFFRYCLEPLYSHPFFFTFFSVKKYEKMSLKIRHKRQRERESEGGKQMNEFYAYTSEKSEDGERKFIFYGSNSIVQVVSRLFFSCCFLLSHYR